MITHVVLFKLKDRSPEAIGKVAQALESLEGAVPVIRSIEVGVDVLRSERSYDVSLTVRFDSLEDLEEYQRHAEHVKVAGFIATLRESSAVVDYEGR